MFFHVLHVCQTFSHVLHVHEYFFHVLYVYQTPLVRCFMHVKPRSMRSSSAIRAWPSTHPAGHSEFFFRPMCILNFLSCPMYTKLFFTCYTYVKLFFRAMYILNRGVCARASRCAFSGEKPHIGEVGVTLHMSRPL